MSGYSTILKAMQPNYDPRHIEAYIRLQHHTLNNLSKATLRFEADVAAGCIDVGGLDDAEKLAKSFGL